MPIPTDDDLTNAHLPGDAVTIGGPAGPVEPRHVATGLPAVASNAKAGAIIAGRYRLVTMLGRGGMGEVYRADDLTLDQAVALKFLPESVTAGDERLNQFHNELRIARRVSHKNVCRLYDLGEAGGRRFLTMEYVDGEDLSSLLRRIGRLPQGKAVEIARQLCAGVAAAHESGVLHRDLKPANLMLDAQGNVRITDFGIATAGEDQHALAGTPHYMAPEQFEGRPASVASDVYAIGLVLYEVFTGRRAIDSPTLAHLQDFHKTGTIPTPSALIGDLDPAIDRLILRCLSKDPARRPPSALAVAAALPGADPVAAALAAGTTPSPEILAAAGEVEAMPARRGIALIALTVLGLLAFATYSARSSVVGRTPLDLPPEVLADRAGQVIASLGYPEPPGDRAYGFLRASDYTAWLFTNRATAQRYQPLGAGNPSAILFWYRSAPRPLQPFVQSPVTVFDPPSTETDMRTVVLDPRGRLREFRSVPPQRDASRDPRAAPPWNVGFVAAGLDLPAFTAAPPEWTPRDYAEVRAAWEGPLGDPEGLRVRVEAGAYRGKIVAFSVVGPWTQPTLMQGRRQSDIDRIINAVITLVVVALFTISALIAHRNLAANRADRRGATRLAAFVTGLGFLVWLLRAHHSSSIPAEYQSLFRALSETALTSVLIWVVYIALEPSVRRLWPDSLLGWSRLMAGHFRDPRVGRDVLIGVVVGVAVSLVDVGKAMILPWLGYAAPSSTYGGTVDILNGPGRMAAAWALGAGSSVQAALIFVLLIVLIRLTLRRPWLTIPVTALLLSVPAMAQSGTTNTLLIMAFPLVTGILFTLLIFRFGLLAFAIAWFVWNVASNAVFVQDWSHWSAAAGNWTLAGLIGLTLFGFYAARAGQPLFGTILRE
jgi:hypothetical protein